MGRSAFTHPRFRFWICTGGISMIGFALGMEGWSSLLRPENFLYLFFFLAATLFISGVNDLFDESTDRNNSKELGSEYRQERTRRPQTVLPIIPVAVFCAALITQNIIGSLIFGGFLLLSSLSPPPPMRFWESRLQVFLPGVLIILPGVLGYYLAAGTLPPPLFVLAGFLHYSATHLFSAIPDGASDQEAGTTAIPTGIDTQASLKICYGFWLIFAVLVVSQAGFHPLSLLAFIYPVFPVSLLLREQMAIDAVHGSLPYVSMVLGGLLFTAVIISKMPAHIPTIL
jgi:4-hydroxybenzoate polyprenyltransferase